MPQPVGRERLSIRFDSVSIVSMGRSIISDVSLTVERGVMNILAGPTLAGKTTIMRLIVGRRGGRAQRPLPRASREVTSSSIASLIMTALFQNTLEARPWHAPGAARCTGTLPPGLLIANRQWRQLERRSRRFARRGTAAWRPISKENRHAIEPGKRYQDGQGAALFVRHRPRPRVGIVQRAARPNTGRQDLAIAADGGLDIPSSGTISEDGADVTLSACESASWRWSTRSS